jgi:predicted phosphodiesterase
MRPPPPQHRTAVRILLVSDIHYALPQFDWVVRAAPQFDLVVLAGDHMDVSSPVSLDTQSLVLLRYFSLARPGKSLVVASGNHDLTGADRHGERAALWLPESRRAGIAIDGDSLLIGDTPGHRLPLVGRPGRARRPRAATGP